MVYTIERIREKAIAAFLKYGAKKVDLFGSYAEGTANEKSDIDLLVEFQAEAVSLFLLSQLKDELEQCLEKPIDLIHGPLMENAMIVPDKMVALYEQ